ncbi:UDP-N-acetylmuramate--L-alanine ligase [Paenibacillus glucanolyticus]|uniref:UDP-N-acetylmuramate--L-alanine ligase n=1 Tax=Paenibacillus glucanolyticus TaxID=59843 RepID=UPI0036869B43
MKSQRYHFIGVKGAGMSALATILSKLGHIVKGSDVEFYVFTEDELHANHVDVLPFDKNNVRDQELVVVSNAFKDDHIEVIECIEKGIPFSRYHHFLGELMKPYSSVAVTGTHGKTTTTALIVHLMGHYKPIVGLIGDGTGVVTGSIQETFVFESCEYRRHFLAYSPEIAVITNIDYDHPDYFHSLSDVVTAFQEMSKTVRGKIIVCGDDRNIQALSFGIPVTTFGIGNGHDVSAMNVQTFPEGMSFDVYSKGTYLGRLQIPLYGVHNVLNALAAISVCLEKEVPFQIISDRIASFKGAKRRFSKKCIQDRVIIDDYAHHPTAVRSTIYAAKGKYPNRKIVAIFEPHTYKRLAEFMHQFAESLSYADHVYVCPLSRFGKAKQQIKHEFTVSDLAALIPGGKTITEQETVELLNHGNAVFLFMGVGNITSYKNALENLIYSQEGRVCIPSTPQ